MGQRKVNAASFTVKTSVFVGIAEAASSEIEGGLCSVKGGMDALG